MAAAGELAGRHRRLAGVAVALTAADVPAQRPAGLRLTSLSGVWWRIDATAPQDWSWRGFPRPRHRFDPAAGGHRVRYAARTERGAFRERFHDSRRRIGAAQTGLWVIELTGRLRVLDLRSERTLDLLGLDDEVNVGRDPRVLAASQRLMAPVIEWYGDDLHGIVYRARTTPTTSANLAFCSWAPLSVAAEPSRLGARTGTLATLVLDDGFTVDGL